jgi:hypothetical protein
VKTPHERRSLYYIHPLAHDYCCFYLRFWPLDSVLNFAVEMDYGGKLAFVTKSLFDFCCWEDFYSHHYYNLYY